MQVKDVRDENTEMRNAYLSPGKRRRIALCDTEKEWEGGGFGLQDVLGEGEDHGVQLHHQGGVQSREEGLVQGISPSWWGCHLLHLVKEHLDHHHVLCHCLVGHHHPHHWTVRSSSLTTRLLELDHLSQIEWSLGHPHLLLHQPEIGGEGHCHHQMCLRLGQAS